MFKTNLPCSITFRNIKSIDLSTLSSTINNLSSKDHLTTPDYLLSHYNNGLHNLLDTLAPLKTQTFTHFAPWFTPALRQPKSESAWSASRRKLDSIHKDMYHNHIMKYKEAISNAKTIYCATLWAVKGSTHTLFSTLNNILQPPDTFASHMYFTALCNSFMNFFTSKIENVPHQLPSPCNTVDCKYCPLPTPPLSSSFSCFHLPTISEISSIICKSKSSTCKLDPLPTNLVKPCLPSLFSPHH